MHLCDDGSQCFVIDPQACRVEPDLVAFASTAHRIDGDDGEAARAGGATGGVQEMYMVFDARGRCAARADTITEILRCPSLQASRGGPGQPVLNITHADRLTPVFDLATALGRAPVSPEDWVAILLVRMGNHSYGFAVSRLCAIASGRYHGSGLPGRDGGPDRDAVVEIGRGNAREFLYPVDLASLLPAETAPEDLA